MCSKILRIRRQNPMKCRELCPFLEITGFTLTLFVKVPRSENFEESSQESTLFIGTNLVLRPA